MVLEAVVKGQGKGFRYRGGVWSCKLDGKTVLGQKKGAFSL